jgi:hypothetical protein
MPSSSRHLRNVTFYALVSAFVLLIALFSPLGRLVGFPFAGVAVLGSGIGLLGLTLVALTLRLQEPWHPRFWFLLAGTSAAGIPICAILHNLVYGLFIVWFGEGFWEGHGTDEPVFFILALIIFPALLVIGAIGSAAFLLKARSGKP